MHAKRLLLITMVFIIVFFFNFSIQVVRECLYFNYVPSGSGSNDGDTCQMLVESSWQGYRAVGKKGENRSCL